MSNLISGIHHVTALAGDPRKNVDFYSGILGLRLLKKTVNFDAPDVYHLYYGDEKGLPGSILTFFPYGDIAGGRHGKGMLNTTSFSIPSAALSFWENRLKTFGIEYAVNDKRFDGEIVLSFKDHDGLGLELVANDKDPRPGFTYGFIPLEFSIRGFYGVEIWEDKLEASVDLLSGYLDHKLLATIDNRYRYAAEDAPGNYVDILVKPASQRGLGGNGTVHHVAFATKNQATQGDLRGKLQATVNPTPIIDRNYFTSIYFREPGGVLFEVATENPGFAVDEDPAHLGEALKLPSQYEAIRPQLEKSLIPLVFKPENYK